MARLRLRHSYLRKQLPPLSKTRRTRFPHEDRDGTEQGVTQGPLEYGRPVDKVEVHIADAVQARRQVAPEETPFAGGTSSSHVLANVAPMRWCHRGNFGPWRRCPFQGEADVIAIVQQSPFGLASILFALRPRPGRGREALNPAWSAVTPD